MAVKDLEKLSVTDRFVSKRVITSKTVVNERCQLS